VAIGGGQKDSEKAAVEYTTIPETSLDTPSAPSYHHQQAGLSGLLGGLGSYPEMFLANL